MGTPPRNGGDCTGKKRAHKGCTRTAARPEKSCIFFGPGEESRHRPVTACSMSLEAGGLTLSWRRTVGAPALCGRRRIVSYFRVRMIRVRARASWLGRREHACDTTHTHTHARTSTREFLAERPLSHDIMSQGQCLACKQAAA